LLRAVLFDLDGTLLDIDLAAFLREYFAALGPAIRHIIGDAFTVQQGLAAVVEGTDAMTEERASGTNQEVFEARFFELTGSNLAAPEASARIKRFYLEEFPALRGSCGPRPGGIAAVRAARDAGLLVALATNPIFPRDAIAERMRWAGLSEDDFDVITSYEIMNASKPAQRYFEQTAEMLGVIPAQCLMVGDDADLDMPAAETGMQTFYVGGGASACARGDLFELADMLRSMSLA